MRKYRDLNLQKSQRWKTLQLIVIIQKWKLAAAPLTLGHPDCRLLVRKRTGAPRYTTLFNMADLCLDLTLHDAEIQYYWSVEQCLVWIKLRVMCTPICRYMLICVEQAAVRLGGVEDSDGVRRSSSDLWRSCCQSEEAPPPSHPRHARGETLTFYSQRQRHESVNREAGNT